jgi:hypothetical protein
MSFDVPECHLPCAGGPQSLAGSGVLDFRLLTSIAARIASGDLAASSSFGAEDVQATRGPQLRPRGTSTKL